MVASQEGLVIALFLGVTASVWLLRLWVTPHLDEAIASRKSLNNGQPYEPPDPKSIAAAHRDGPLHRLSRHGRTAWLMLPVLPLAVLADPRTWLRDVLSDCAEADGTALRVLIVVSHVCAGPTRIRVVWSGRCRKLIGRLRPR
jgi:hypothetical protein